MGWASRANATVGFVKAGILKPKPASPIRVRAPRISFDVHYARYRMRQAEQRAKADAARVTADFAVAVDNAAAVVAANAEGALALSERIGGDDIALMQHGVVALTPAEAVADASQAGAEVIENFDHSGVTVRVNPD